MNKKYFIRTFGCQMNVADSERIAGWYESKGWKQAKEMAGADEVVINTCSVRESAENRVYGQINNLAKSKVTSRRDSLNGASEKLKVILTGCMMRYPLADLRKKLPQVDEFKRISEFSLSSKFIIHCSNIHAYVPIMEGCNNYCSYCVVPYARGREVSRPFEEIICEVKELINRGYKEVTLLGQNVNSFEPSFAMLLRQLHEIPRLKKISFMTSNPWDLNDDIIKAMSLPKIDRYLHLAVQSGDDEILKRMNRKYTIRKFINLVKKIKQKIPEIKIGTDIIIGFPGETEKQFQNTVNLCKKIGFEKAYISIYSPRPGTVAFKMKELISFKEKRRRWRILEKLINQKFI